jgi:hypothetical protein
MNEIPNRAKLFIVAIMLAAAAITVYAMLGMHPWHHYQFAMLLAISLIASRLKLKLPGLNGNMSVNLPFILIAQAQLSPAEALIIACASTLTQCLPRAGAKLKPVQVLFNISTMAIAVELGWLVLHHGQHLKIISSWTLLLALSAAAFFLANTLPVAGIISLSEGLKVLKVWSSIFHLSFPYYVLSAGMTSIVTTASYRIGWPIPVLVLPVMYGVYRSYRLYFGQAAKAPCTVLLAKAAGATH